MNAPVNIPAVPMFQDLSFVRTVKKGRGSEVRYFHVEPTGDAGSDYESGIRKAVEYLDFLKAGGHFPLQFLIFDVLKATQDRAISRVANGFLCILSGCIAGAAKSLQYHEWSELVIQEDRAQRASLDAWDAVRKSEAKKKAWVTRKANLARKRGATVDGSAVAGACHV